MLSAFLDESFTIDSLYTANSEHDPNKTKAMAA